MSWLSDQAHAIRWSKEMQLVGAKPWDGGNGLLDDAAQDDITPGPCQKLRADVFRHTIRASENVCHNGGFLTCVIG